MDTSAGKQDVGFTGAWTFMMPIVRVFNGVREHVSMFLACRGQPVLSPTRHVTSLLSARCTRLRSPIFLFDTLPLCRRWC